MTNDHIGSAVLAGATRFASRGYRALRRFSSVAALGVALSVTLPSPGHAQLQYNRTSFLNGFYSDTGIWKASYTDIQGYTPVGYLAQTHFLDTVLYLNVNRNLNWHDEVADVAPKIAGTTQHVLVVHSLGTLVARGIYIDSARTRANIKAIIAMGAPHEGTYLADSAYKARSFLLDVQRRVNDGVDVLNLTVNVVALVGASVTMPYLGPAWAALAVYVGQWLQNQKLDLSAIAQLTQVPALPDLITTGPTVKYLTSHTEDSAIPRYNIVGSIPLKNAALRIKTSLAGGSQRDFLDLVHARDRAVKAFEACRVVTWSIVTMTQSRRCAYAARVLKRVDDRWGRYVNGSETINLPVFGPVTRARNIPFDGIVSNEHSQYPGLTDATYTATATGANHQNLYASTQGLSAASTAMGVIGMAPASATPTLSISISGPSSLASGATGTWTANVSGGTAPFTYQWSGELQGTGPKISGPAEGVLTLDVWDSAGLHKTTSKTITLQTGCGTRKAC